MGTVLPFESPSVGDDEQRGDVDWDDDADIGELSSAGAEQVTVQIRTMVERAWEYIAIAYQGRAYLALGYRTWDEYVDDRLGDLRLTVPREERAEAVATMSNARMSVRAIAKVLGVGIGTVHRGLAGKSAAPDVDDGSTIQGRDGKTYRRRMKGGAVQECSICGEFHPESPDECPWDLFAQGLGPRPGTALHAVDDPAEHISPTPGRQHDDAPRDVEPPAVAIPAAVEAAVVRALRILDELDDLTQLVDDIESVSGAATLKPDAMAVIASATELAERLRLQIDALARARDRLERFTEAMAGDLSHR
ncbi:hypothetical protein [Nakamurella multipartita]|uniref:Uncharacterized protein n=1 Tax=Nakamurella multipartita (strain ATCC 700099 / DSM 44233 / CIP 104796 / JCM 9543 / NBRC 105858 / Y-104) TaxID=479431 RepID=C8XHC8_NAKMY|nr:hypothetical protein [Nakamurella multipartita]ACV78334.1 hypothetical protein Namu_1945 [Nakamurella multipartita DSM 44233]